MRATLSPAYSGAVSSRRSGQLASGAAGPYSGMERRAPRASRSPTDMGSREVSAPLRL